MSWTLNKEPLHAPSGALYDSERHEPIFQLQVWAAALLSHTWNMDNDHVQSTVWKMRWRKWRVTWLLKATLSGWKQLTDGNFVLCLTVFKSEMLLFKPTPCDTVSLVRSCSPSQTLSPPGLTREWFTAIGVNESSTPGNIPPCLFTTSIISHKHRDSSKLFPPFHGIFRASSENIEDPLTQNLPLGNQTVCG